MNKSNFRSWETIAGFDLPVVADYILGTNLSSFSHWEQLFPVLGDKDKTLKILDFGCGIGRNTFGAGMYSRLWDVTGYDSETMLSRVDEYRRFKSIPDLSNVAFESNWGELKTQNFDVCFAVLVFQHIYEEDLLSYLDDLKTMTKKLVVYGRRINDDRGKNTWKILESQGLISKCIDGWKKLELEGDPEGHDIGVFEFEK